MFLFKKKVHRHNWFTSDNHFNELYHNDIRQLAARHWTPLNVARKAASFLTLDGAANILDVGSGAGKFCLAAAHYYPQASYYGIEQRAPLVHCARETQEVLGLDNISFIHGNFTQLDFNEYDHFYFYNSFYENIEKNYAIDQSIAYSAELYHYYTHYMYSQLSQKSRGTRIVTFHSLEDEIPGQYRVVRSEMNELLKYWIKVD